MFNNRLVKMGFFALVIVSITVLALGWSVGTSLAQGPGGRGGQGQGQGQGQPFGGQGNGRQQERGFVQQQQSRLMDGTCTNCLFNLPPVVPGDVPADVMDALSAGLADEHNAYNTYQAVIDQFGAVRPFTNIQRAEAQHIAALEFLFERYSLEIPEATPLTDVPTFGTLADACAAGVTAEIANFALYDSWIETVQDYPDMVQVFTALRSASENQHLPAFERCAG